MPITLENVSDVAPDPAMHRPAEPGPGVEPREPLKTRVPFHQAGGRRRLFLPQSFVDRKEREGMHLCWANDDLGNLQAYLAAGCQFVKRSDLGKNLDVGDAHVGSGNTSLDGNVSLIVGDNRENKPMRAYLLEKPIKFHEEDMAILASMADQRDAAAERGETDSKGSQIEKGYIPQDGGVTIRHGH